MLILGGQIAKIDSLEALRPYIRIVLFRDAQTTNEASMDHCSLRLPATKEPYDSGYTLDYLEQLTADWSNEDQQAFNSFLASERMASYFQDALKVMANAGAQYQKNLCSWIDEVCGKNDDDDDFIEHWDDYDLFVAVLIFTDSKQPEEQAQLDLWHRMQATREILCNNLAPGVLIANTFQIEPALEISKQLRDKKVLENMSQKHRNWLHKQSIVIANDLFDLVGPEGLKAKNQEAYRIIKSVALTTPNH